MEGGCRADTRTPFDRLFIFRCSLPRSVRRRWFKWTVGFLFDDDRQGWSKSSPLDFAAERREYCPDSFLVVRRFCTTHGQLKTIRPDQPENEPAQPAGSQAARLRLPSLLLHPAHPLSQMLRMFRDEACEG